MTVRSFLIRLAKDEDGSHTTEMALAIALFALVAGFGFFTFGDALADFFVGLGGHFDSANLAVPAFGVDPLTN
jgi:Flp pilus assembly pilin Flp